MDEDTDIFADPPEPAGPSTPADKPFSSSNVPQPMHTGPTLDRLSLTSSPVAADTSAGTHHSGHSHAADQHAAVAEASDRDSAERGGPRAPAQAGNVPAGSSSSIAGAPAGATLLESSSVAAAKHPFEQASEPSGAGAAPQTGTDQAHGPQSDAAASPEPMQMDPPAAANDEGAT